MCKNYHPIALSRFVAMLVVGALFLGLITPASAQSVSASCSPGFLYPSFSLVGDAHYSVDGAWHVWYLFAGRVAGTGRKSNNINFYFYNNYQQHWTNFSPDTIRDNVWYSKTANIRIPASNAEQVRFEGVFDVNNQSDPSCSAWSPVI